MRASAVAGGAVPVRAARWPAISAGTLADGLVVASVLLLFLLSGNALRALGSSYGAPGGNPIGKLHPGILAAVAALAARVVAVGPRRSLELMLGRFPGAGIGAAACTFAAVYIAIVLRTPVTPVIQTFVLPIVLFAAVALRGSPPPALAPLLHAIFAADALLGLFEFVAHVRLTPIVAGTEVLDDWRSSALFGHPLENAMLGATYIGALLFARPRGLPAGWRWPAVLLQAAAQVVFGGRVAIALVVLLLAGFLALEIGRVLAGARLRLRRVALGVGIAVAFAAGLVLLAESGFFDLVLGRFVSDAGSANTRVVMFRILGSIPTEGLLLGPDAGLVDGMMRREGLEYGIESFPLALVFLYGLVVAGLLMGGLMLFSRDVVRATRPAGAAVFGMFLLVAASSTSLAAKTAVVTMVGVMVLALYAPPQGYLRGGRADRRA